jgi:hypothetical protein
MGDTISTLLFQPPNPSKLKEHKIVWLKTRRGKRVPGFYISYRRQGGVENCRSLTADEISDNQPEEGITLLYSHANAEDLGSIYPWCKFLSKMLQVNLFAYDYAGYGKQSQTLESDTWTSSSDYNIRCASLFTSNSIIALIIIQRHGCRSR